ncbi:MAG TPA: hypothetical protein VFJ24_12445 [Gaiellales bacterium]|nr:hypothetical protein [Gaiellales bacterium]
MLATRIDDRDFNIRGRLRGRRLFPQIDGHSDRLVQSPVLPTPTRDAPPPRCFAELTPPHATGRTRTVAPLAERCTARLCGGVNRRDRSDHNRRGRKRRSERSGYGSRIDQTSAHIRDQRRVDQMIARIYKHHFREAARLRSSQSGV